MQTVYPQVLEATLYRETTPVFIYKIHYPAFATTCNPSSAQAINNIYARRARAVEDYCHAVLFPAAAADAAYAQGTRPFNSYTLDMDFHLTLNTGCFVSLYTETYTYMGGAHGETRRTSDTWDFTTGRRLNLKDILPQKENTADQLFASMTAQVRQRLEETPGAYFDNYEELLRSAFNPESFYLRPGVLVIYFQQYDIAPYVTGLPEFYFPGAGIGNSSGRGLA